AWRAGSDPPLSTRLILTNHQLFEVSSMTSLLVRLRAFLLSAVAAMVLSGVAHAQGKIDRDIFDFEGQRKAEGYKRIVFIGDTRPHGDRGNHEFVAAAVYLAKTINAYDPKAWAVVTTMQKMPTDLKHADAIVVLMNHAGPAAESKAVKEAID